MVKLTLVITLYSCGNQKSISTYTYATYVARDKTARVPNKVDSLQLDFLDDFIVCFWKSKFYFYLFLSLNLNGLSGAQCTSPLAVWLLPH